MRYRLLDSGGRLLDEGTGDAVVEGGALFLPETGLRVAAADLADVAETTEPYGLRLRFSDGGVLELTMMGRMRGQILGDLSDARPSALAADLHAEGLGEAEVFTGFVGSVRGTVRVHDDCLVVLPDSGEPERIPYSFVDDAALHDYRITITGRGRPPLVVSGLAHQTTEFFSLVDRRVKDSGRRTSAFLGALLPGLGPMALRSAAGLLRDGRAAARADLDRLDPALWPSLITATTLPERRDGAAVLERLGPPWIGFKQISSVWKEAEGVTPWHDSSHAPNLDHGGYGGYGGGGYGGGYMGGMGFGGPFGSMGPGLAYGMLGWGGGAYGGGGAGGGYGGGFAGGGYGAGDYGGGYGSGGYAGGGYGAGGYGGGHVPTPRPDMTRGLLTPAHDDLDALSVSGEDPSILAFLLCTAGPGRVVYEVLNLPDHATYVYRDADVSMVNRNLELLGFAADPIHEREPDLTSRADRSPALRILRERFAGRVVHTDDWEARLRELTSR